MSKCFGKPYLQKYWRILLCVSIFLLLFLQVAEATHQHPLEQDLGAHHCLVCQKSHNADHIIHSTFVGFDLLVCADERIVNHPVFSSSYDRLIPRSRSPPVTRH